MLTKIKLYLFAAIGAVMAGLALWGKAMSNKAEKYEQKAKEKTREAESATELANTHSELAQAQQQARTERNELIKERTNEKPAPGVDFNRNRLHKDRDKD